MKKSIALLIVTVAMLLYACKHDPPDTPAPVAGRSCDTALFTFSARIKPIFEAVCKDCHSGPAPQGLFDITDFNQVFTKRMKIRMRISLPSTDTLKMPRGIAKLSDCEIMVITKWINAGAPNN